ncbi:hypothetical protein G3A43_06380 [Paraburkholderia aspalathi]|nr:hypothetical protein [Paraburkholderia aspalathi]MBK3779875.1 hypothetical protein [Paraburkholderia aspalathi]
MEKHISFKTPSGTLGSQGEAVAACERAGVPPADNITVNVSPTDVAVEHAYGTTFRLSQPVRVF